MFNSQRARADAFAGRVGRIVFGAVLLAGAELLVYRLLASDQPRAAVVLVSTWLVAAAAAVVARELAVRVPRRASASLAVPALVVPAVGVALLAPLTLHLPFALWIGGAGGFDSWARWSLAISGASHVVFAALVAARAHRLARHGAPLSPWRIYAVTVVVSAVPFALLFMIPPLVVALTGLPLIPLMTVMERFAPADEPQLPVAIALHRAAA